MGLMTRLVRIWKADVHGVMDQLEDRQLVVKQCLREMEEDLLRLEARLEQCDRQLRGAGKRLEEWRDEFQRLGGDLEIALEGGKEEIARMIVRKRLGLRAHIDETERRAAALDEECGRLREKLAERRRIHERLQGRAAASFPRGQESGSGLWEEGSRLAVPEPEAEEIELELLKEKARLRQAATEKEVRP